MYCIGEKCQILHRQRFIETELLAEQSDGLRSRVFPQHLSRRVAGCELEHQERDRADGHEQGHQAEQTSDDVRAHERRLYSGPTLSTVTVADSVVPCTTLRPYVLAFQFGRARSGKPSPTSTQT